MAKIVFILLFVISGNSLFAQKLRDASGAIIRSDTLQKNIYLCFTGHDYYDGFEHVLEVLKKQKIQASFFLTGDFIRNHKNLVKKIAENGHFVGAHSDKHLLYCDWNKRDSLLCSPDEIKADIQHNLQELVELGIHPDYFIPPFEWCNQEVVEIAKQLGQTTVNFAPGTRSNADYTTPDMANYLSSKVILKNVNAYEKKRGMNGFHLLIHPGTSPLRKDKLYLHLNQIIAELKKKGYHFQKFGLP